MNGGCSLTATFHFSPVRPPVRGKGGFKSDLGVFLSPADGPLEMPFFQLIPSQRQLVFNGDRLPLQCTASYLDRSLELWWRHNGHIVNTHEDRGVYVEETLLHDCCLLTRYWGRGRMMKERKNECCLTGRPVVDPSS